VLIGNCGAWGLTVLPVSPPDPVWPDKLFCFGQNVELGDSDDDAYLHRTRFAYLQSLQKQLVPEPALCPPRPSFGPDSHRQPGATSGVVTPRSPTATQIGGGFLQRYGPSEVRAALASGAQAVVELLEHYRGVCDSGLAPASSGLSVDNGIALLNGVVQHTRPNIPMTRSSVQLHSETGAATAALPNSTSDDAGQAATEPTTECTMRAAVLPMQASTIEHPSSLLRAHDPIAGSEGQGNDSFCGENVMQREHAKETDVRFASSSRLNLSSANLIPMDGQPSTTEGRVTQPSAIGGTMPPLMHSTSPKPRLPVNETFSPHHNSPVDNKLGKISIANAQIAMVGAETADDGVTPVSGERTTACDRAREALMDENCSTAVCTAVADNAARLASVTNLEAVVSGLAGKRHLVASSSPATAETVASTSPSAAHYGLQTTARGSRHNEHGVGPALVTQHAADAQDWLAAAAGQSNRGRGHSNAIASCGNADAGSLNALAGDGMPGSEKLRGTQSLPAASGRLLGTNIATASVQDHARSAAAALAVDVQNTLPNIATSGTCRARGEPAALLKVEEHCTSDAACNAHISSISTNAVLCDAAAAMPAIDSIHPDALDGMPGPTSVVAPASSNVWCIRPGGAAIPSGTMDGNLDLDGTKGCSNASKGLPQNASTSPRCEEVAREGGTEALLHVSALPTMFGDGNPSARLSNALKTGAEIMRRGRQQGSTAHAKAAALHDTVPDLLACVQEDNNVQQHSFQRLQKGAFSVLGPISSVTLHTQETTKDMKEQPGVATGSAFPPSADNVDPVCTKHSCSRQILPLPEIRRDAPLKGVMDGDTQAPASVTPPEGVHRDTQAASVTLAQSGLTNSAVLSARCWTENLHAEVTVVASEAKMPRDVCEQVDLTDITSPSAGDGSDAVCEALDIEAVGSQAAADTEQSLACSVVWTNSTRQHGAHLCVSALPNKVVGKPRAIQGTQTGKELVLDQSGPCCIDDVQCVGDQVERQVAPTQLEHGQQHPVLPRNEELFVIDTLEAAPTQLDPLQACLPKLTPKKRADLKLSTQLEADQSQSALQTLTRQNPLRGPPLGVPQQLEPKEGSVPVMTSPRPTQVAAQPSAARQLEVEEDGSLVMTPARPTQGEAELVAPTQLEAREAVSPPQNSAGPHQSFAFPALPTQLEAQEAGSPVQKSAEPSQPETLVAVPQHWEVEEVFLRERPIAEAPLTEIGWKANEAVKPTNSQDSSGVCKSQNASSWPVSTLQSSSQSNLRPTPCIRDRLQKMKSDCPARPSPVRQCQVNLLSCEDAPIQGSPRPLLKPSQAFRAEAHVEVPLSDAIPPGYLPEDCQVPSSDLNPHGQHSASTMKPLPKVASTKAKGALSQQDAALKKPHESEVLPSRARDGARARRASAPAHAAIEQPSELSTAGASVRAALDEHSTLLGASKASVAACEPCARVRTSKSSALLGSNVLGRRERSEETGMAEEGTQDADGVKLVGCASDVPSTKRSRKGLQPRRVVAPGSLVESKRRYGDMSAVAWSPEPCAEDGLKRVRKLRWSAPAARGQQGPFPGPVQAIQTKGLCSKQQCNSERSPVKGGLVQANDHCTVTWAWQSSAGQSLDGVKQQSHAEGDSLKSSVMQESSRVKWGRALAPMDTENVCCSCEAAAALENAEQARLLEHPLPKRRCLHQASPMYKAAATCDHVVLGGACHAGSGDCTQSAQCDDVQRVCASQRHHAQDSGFRPVESRTALTWASKSAGVSMRGAEVPRDSSEALVQATMSRDRQGARRGAFAQCADACCHGIGSGVGLPLAPRASAPQGGRVEPLLAVTVVQQASTRDKRKDCAIRTDAGQGPGQHSASVPLRSSNIEGALSPALGIGRSVSAAVVDGRGARKRKIGFQVRGLAMAKARLQGALPWW
jgi:hypothetical protein